MREKKPLTTTYRNTKTEYGKKITHGHFIHTHTHTEKHAYRKSKTEIDKGSERNRDRNKNESRNSRLSYVNRINIVLNSELAQCFSQ